MPKAARNTERLQALVQALEERRTDLNTHQVDYVTEKIEKRLDREATDCSSQAVP